MHTGLQVVILKTIVTQSNTRKQKSHSVLSDKMFSHSKKAEGNVAIFIAEHIALRVVDHLSDLFKTFFADSKGFRDLTLRRSEFSAIICNVIAPHFMEDLLAGLGKKCSLIV